MRARASRYRLTSKRLDRITPAERRRLNYLTLRNEGRGNPDRRVSAMREDILQRKKFLNLIQLFIIRDADGVIVAWSSILPRKGGDYIYTYVMRVHRRQGLGTRLLDRATRWCAQHGRQSRVISWDGGSNKFFSTLPQTVKVQIARIRR